MQPDRARRWLALAYGGDVTGNHDLARPEAAARLLCEAPELVADAYGACAVGDEAVLGAAIAADPHWVDRAGGPLKRGGLQYLVESCYRRAGITDRVPRGAQLHALRHTFATRLAEDGANASEIMRLLGHASLTTSQGYIEVTAEQQRAAVRANRTNRALRGL